MMRGVFHRAGRGSNELKSNADATPAQATRGDIANNSPRSASTPDINAQDFRNSSNLQEGSLPTLGTQTLEKKRRMSPLQGSSSTESCSKYSGSAVMMSSIAVLALLLLSTLLLLRQDNHHLDVAESLIRDLSLQVKGLTGSHGMTADQNTDVQAIIQCIQSMDKIKRELDEDKAKIANLEAKMKKQNVRNSALEVEAAALVVKATELDLIKTKIQHLEKEKTTLRKRLKAELAREHELLHENT